MLKRLLSFGIVLGFAFCILLPNSLVYAETKEDDTATEEEADAEENANEEETDDEEANEEDVEAEESEEESETAAASEEPTDWSIYFYVIGFVSVLIIGMYAFTEGTRKSNK